MQALIRFSLGILAGALALSARGQTITDPIHTYDVADGLVQWTFNFNEGSSTSTISHLVLTFDGTDAIPPAVAWNSLSNVTIFSSSVAVTKGDVWTSTPLGQSYLELNLASPIVLDGNSSTFSFSFLTGGINNLNNAPSVTFLVDLRSGVASTNAGLDGASIAFNNNAGNGGNLTAVPEPATYALLAGLAMLGFAMVRRRRQAA